MSAYRRANGSDERPPYEFSDFESEGDESHNKEQVGPRNSHDDKLDRLLEVIERRELRESGRDKTAIPNWFMPIIFVALFGLIGLIYKIQTDRLEAQDSDLRAWKAYTINLTLELNKRGIPTAPLPEPKK